MRSAGALAPHFPDPVEIFLLVYHGTASVCSPTLLVLDDNMLGVLAAGGHQPLWAHFSIPTILQGLACDLYLVLSNSVTVNVLCDVLAKTCTQSPRVQLNN